MSMTGKSSWHWAVFILCLLTFGFSGVKHANEEAHRQYAAVEKAEWGATNVWIRAAECAREKGAWLAICENGKLFPLADHALADDPGYALLLGLAARLKDRSMNLVDVARLNILINLVGMVSVAALLFAARCQLASLFVLMLGSVPYFSWVGVAPHPSLIGVASMAFIFPAAILLVGLGYLAGVSRLVFLFIGAALLALASLLREPIGTIGIVVSLGAIIYLGSIRFGQNNKWVLLILLIVGLSAWQSPRWVLMARDAFFPIQTARYIQTHGTSHNLYIGLGAAGENKFGIHWDDSEGAAAVKRVDPGVAYVSPEYYRILWRLYFDKVVEDPLEVARIYVVKLGEILKHRLPSWSPPLWLFLVGICALLGAGYRRRLWKSTDFHAAPILILSAMAFIGMFIAQGVLAHPSRQYAHPIGGFVLLIWAIGLELFVRHIIRKEGSVEKRVG